MRKSRKEIAEELAKLETLRGKLRMSVFGDDNNEALENQIKVLKNELTYNKIDEMEDFGDLSQHTASAARDACYWKDGEGECVSLFDEWSGLVKGK